MFGKLFTISFRLSFLVLACNFFLHGQQNSFSQATFQKCWGTAEVFAGNIASDNASKIFLSLSDGIIKALDTKGVEIWKTEVGGKITHSPRYNKGHLFVISMADSNPAETETNEETSNSLYSITALDADSGISVWRRDFQSEQTPIITTQMERLVIVLNRKINLDGYASKLIILEELTGKLFLQKDFDFEIKQILSTKSKNRENVYMLTSLNTLGSFSIMDGKTTFINTAAKSIQTIAPFDGGFLLSNERRGIYLIDRNGNEHQFKIRFGAGISSITHHKNSILFTSLDNFIYSTTIDGKKLNWKRRFAGRITEKPVINQDALLAYSQGENALYLLNHEDGKILNRIAVADDREIIGLPVFLENFLFVMTNKGLEVFAKESCKSFRAGKN